VVQPSPMARFGNKAYLARKDSPNIIKLKKLLDNLKPGDNFSISELSNKSGATRETVREYLKRDYPQLGLGTGSKLQVAALAERGKAKGEAEYKKLLDKGYLTDYKKKIETPKGVTSKNLSNKALAKKYYPNLSEIAGVARIERANARIRTEYPDLVYEKGSPRETYLRRKSRIDESKKFLSDSEKAILRKQNSQKKLVNSFFKNNPNAINDPKYQKVKDLMNARFKDGKISFDVRPEKYYVNKAKGGKLFDLFDISAVASEKRNIRFPSNLNITPGQFNQAFIKQLTTYFDKNPNDIQALNEVESFLKSNGIRVEVPALGKRIGETAISSIDSSTGRLPNIENTFKKIGIDNLITKDYIPPKKILEVVKSQYNSEPAGSVFRKGMDNLVKCADGCFVKVANKNPERIAKKLSEEPQKLIRLFRGESFPQRNIKQLKKTAKDFGTTLAEMKKDTMSGQWYTPNQAHAGSYLARPGRMKYVDVTPAELAAFNRYKDRVNKTNVKWSRAALEGKPFKQNITTSEFHQVIPRYKLKQMEKAGRLKTKYDLNPFGKRNMDDILVKPTKGVLEYDPVLGAFVDSANPDEVVGQNQLKTWAADNPMPVQAGTSVKPGLLRKTGRALAHLGLPLPTAAIDTYFIGRQIEEGRDPAEIAKDPFNWIGLATMEPLTKAAGVADKSGKLASIMRLGMSPGMIRGATRFLGLPGLAISTGLTAYDQYKKYQDKEGFIYDLFNKVDNTDV
jgi:hypothetical protein